MRKAMQSAVRQAIVSRDDSVLLLVDIGAWPFHDLLEKYPQRAKNIGIFEPGTVGIASGLSLAGLTPIVYGITPFIVERAFEQLKLDFVYQKTGGNFITTGASYDFSKGGYSHYCPEDVALLRQLPGVDILTPGTPAQFTQLWEACAWNGRTSYFRLSDHASHTAADAVYGKASVIQTGTRGLVLCAAETLDLAAGVCAGLDVSLLHYATMQPFDGAALREAYRKDIFIIEPFYSGTMEGYAVEALRGMPVRIEGAGVPREVLRSYGTKEQKDEYCGLTADGIRSRLTAFLGL